jgi:hypothetical protein
MASLAVKNGSINGGRDNLSPPPSEAAKGVTAFIISIANGPRQIALSGRKKSSQGSQLFLRPPRGERKLECKISFQVD